jgi:putative transposase
LTRAIITLASNYGRYGYRRITALLRIAGWQVGKDRVQRIWRREGLKVPTKQKARRRLWLNDGSCVRLRPERANHVWSYDFVSAMTHDGRGLRMLTLIDEYTRECVAIRVARRLQRYKVIEALAERHAVPGNPGEYSFGQRSRVRGGRAAEMTGGAGHRDAVHRTRESALGAVCD